MAITVGHPLGQWEDSVVGEEVPRIMVHPQGVLDILREEVVYGILKPVGEGARTVVAQAV